MQTSKCIFKIPILFYNSGTPLYISALLAVQHACISAAVCHTILWPSKLFTSSSRVSACS